MANQKEMSASQQQYDAFMPQNIFFQSPIPMMVLDPVDLTIKTANNAFLTLTQMSGVEIIGQPVAVFPEIEQIVMAFAVKHHSTYSEKLFLDDVSAELSWQKLTVSEIYDEEDSVTDFLLIFENITEYEKEQDNLLELFLQYHRILANLPRTAIILFDQSLNVLVAEGPSLLAAGYGTEDIKGKKLSDVFSHDTLSRLEPVYLDVLRGIPFYETYQQGELVYETLFMPVYGEDNTVAGGMMISQDITERYQAQQALQNNMELTQAVLNALPDVLMRLDVSGNLKDLYIHHEDEVLLNNKATIGQNIGDLFAPSVAGVIQDRINDVMNGSGACTFEQALDNDTVRSYREIRIVPFGTQQVLCLIRDITDRKQAEIALQESERRYRELFEGISDLIIVHDHQGTILEANSAACHQLEMSLEELIGENIYALTGENYSVEALESLPNMLTVRLDALGQQSFDVNIKHISYQDRPAILAVFRDLSDRIRAENALRESEQRFRLLAETIEDVFWIRSEDFQKLYYLSPAFEHIWGYPVSDQYRNPNALLDSIHVQDLVKFYNHDTTREHWTREYRITRPDTSQRWIRERGYLTEIDGERQIIGIASDITEEKRIAHLKAAGEIAVGVAHQINNPLTTVIVQSSRLLRKLDHQDRMYEAALDIKTAATNAAQIVQRLLNLSRIDLTEMNRVDINRSVQETVDLLRPQIEPELGQIVLDMKVQDAVVYGNAEYLQDVWANLLLNARDAIKSSKDGLIKVTTVLNQDRNMLEVTVFDNGVGISQEHIGEIFKPFFTDKRDGTGLGLAICHDIISRHKGSLNVYSRPGYGTIFSVMLPLMKQDA